MKSATIPPIRVAPEFRTEVEAVLTPGESLSVFVENAIRETVARRKNQTEFMARGIAAIEDTKRNASGIAAEVVLGRLEGKLTAAKKAKAQHKA